MAETTEIMTRVTADTRGFKKGMSDVGRSLLMAGGKVSRFGTAMNANFRAITLGATAVGAGLTAGFLKDASELFIEFNDTLVRTQAVMNTTAGEAVVLEKTIRAIGANTRFTATQAAQAAEVLAIAGVSFNEMVDDEVIDKLVKFAIAGGVDIETATTIGVASVKAFRMEIGDLDKATDVLVQTFTSANVDIVTLGEAMKFVAPVAAAAGVGIEETAAAIGALGNAGLRGTVAGTGLRMAINKLLKPTFDARKVINDLNLDVFVLSDAGVAANQALKATMNQMAITTRITERLSMEVKGLQSELNDLAMEERKNTLAISEIRFRAAQQNRDLNESELDQIRRLELANDNLNITTQKRTLELMETSGAMKKAEARQESLKETGDSLLKTVEMQTTGLTSLTDLLHQMRDANITAAQALEIFGVRGGTAVLSLNSQVDAFDKLAAANYLAEGRTVRFAETLQKSSYEAMRVFKSQVEEASLSLGVHFVRALFDMEAAGEKSSGVISDFGKTLNEPGGLVEQLTPQVVELANTLKENLPEAIDTLVTTIPLFLEVLQAVATSLPTFAKIGKVLVALVTPFVRLFGLFTDFAQAIADFVADPSVGGLIKIFSTLFHLVLEAIVVFSGIGYVFRVLGVYFEDTNESLSNMFHLIADLSGIFKGFTKILTMGLKPLVKGQKGFKAIDDAAGPLTKKLQELQNILPGLRRMFPKTNPLTRGLKRIDDILASLVKRARDFGGWLKKLPGIKQIVGLRAKLRDPRSAGQINNSNLATARWAEGGGFQKGQTMESMGIPKLATGGIVTAPTFAQVGEAGDEAVIPLNPRVLSQIGEGITFTQPDIDLSQIGITVNQPDMDLSQIGEGITFTQPKMDLSQIGITVTQPKMDFSQIGEGITVTQPDIDLNQEQSTIQTLSKLLKGISDSRQEQIEPVQEQLNTRVLTQIGEGITVTQPEQIEPVQEQLNTKELSKLLKGISVTQPEQEPVQEQLNTRALSQIASSIGEGITVTQQEQLNTRALSQFGEGMGDLRRYLGRAPEPVMVRAPEPVKMKAPEPVKVEVDFIRERKQKKSSDTVINVNLGGITITGDNQDKDAIKRMMERELPRIISRSVRSGASGSI